MLPAPSCTSSRPPPSSFPSLPLPSMSDTELPVTPTVVDAPVAEATPVDVPAAPTDEAPPSADEAVPSDAEMPATPVAETPVPVTASEAEVDAPAADAPEAEASEATASDDGTEPTAVPEPKPAPAEAAPTQHLTLESLSEVVSQLLSRVQDLEDQVARNDSAGVSASAGATSPEMLAFDKARGDFLLKLVAMSFGWQRTAPVLGLKDVAPEDIPHLSQYFQNATNYTHLDASYTEICPSSLAHLLNIPLKNELFTSADFSGCKLGPASGPVIGEFLSKNPDITSLSLQSNELGDDGLLRSSELSPSFVGGLAFAKSLKSLNLSANGLTEKSIEELAAVLGTIRLQSLFIGRNNIGPKGLERLCQAVANSSITHLTIQESGAGDEAAQHIADLIKNAKNLKFLHIANNKIGDEGGEVILRALGSPSCQLFSLVMFNNNLGPKSAAALAEALPNNSSLREFDLRYCKFEDASCGALLVSAATASQLTSFNTHGCVLSADVQKQIQEGLRTKDASPTLEPVSSPSTSKRLRNMFRQKSSSSSLSTNETGGTATPPAGKD
ncbi:hypothetical protein H696_03393 [Fonticula alba]|uniref:Ran GTPase-activating protein 1 n=1 Tax=Fonticula alba TaxID=691883 RepID=A0A058Z7N3_FONAL|nr:hypothetical protein H696_03393 [Fonticula alba]KCV69928.1 hypothetical protein H696_03393 [Fonticula alba]|eukprot:XP_009495534.1 hypothetical protein H696_03393 [Fonticula alba]